ncbi:FtsX-like permease family protein [Actinoplanes sp. GCM10030250]|uniref:FtsX-like permease family protein n=1 Tax=Actinoplanes sp. GCM10030250 TaxID=3273376 RepID=UPI0036181ED6
MTLSTLRTRWVTLVGTFVALALGVALIATMGLGLASTFDAPAQRPERFAGASVVVRGADELRVRSAIGDRVQPLAEPRGVAPELAAALAARAHTVADRSFPLHVAGVGELVGHPWSVAGFGGYRIVAGHEPRGPGDVVLAGAPALVGEAVQVYTPAGLGRRTVVGVVAPSSFEAPMFFTDDEAANLSPRIDNLVVRAAPDLIRTIAGPGVQVLTGDDRHRADPEPDRDRDALIAMNALLGTAGGVTTFVSVFVVASTFAFAVAQRRREIGLLRTAGATPRQVRRMMFLEALLVGVVASAAGCVLGSYGAPRLASLLVQEELAPSWFRIGTQLWPYHMAFWLGLIVALVGVLAATVRAGRVRPVEALSEASVDSRAMPPGRWIPGAGLLVCGLGMLFWRMIADPGEALHRKTYTTQPMVLITAVALLAPVLVRWLIPPRLPGAIGMLVRENAAAAVRRTAAIAAPVLVTVALAGSLLGATATINEAKRAEIRDQTRADLIAVGDFDDRTVEQVRQVPGAAVTASAATTVYALEDGVALVRSDARAVEARELVTTRNLPVVAGSLSDLDDDGIVVNEEWARHTVGERVEVWLGDGTKVSLRIVAVIATGTGSNGVYVTRRNAPGAVTDRLEITWASDAAAGAATARAISQPAGTAAVRALLQPAGATVRTRAEWIRSASPGNSRQTRAGFLVVLGIALIYTGIALAGTMVMATSDRVRDLTLLRLAGATKRQVLVLAAVEAVTVVAVGAVLGLIVTAVNLLGIQGSLAALSVRSPIVLPWQAIAATVGACAVVAVIAAVVPATLALRSRRPALGAVQGADG